MKYLLFLLFLFPLFLEAQTVRGRQPGTAYSQAYTKLEVRNLIGDSISVVHDTTSLKLKAMALGRMCYLDTTGLEGWWIVVDSSDFAQAPNRGTVLSHPTADRVWVRLEALQTPETAKIEWFGAISGDNTSDAAIAIERAIDAGIRYITCGSDYSITNFYYILSVCDIDVKGVTLEGGGFWRKTIFQGSGIDTLFNVTNQYCTFKNVEFVNAGDGSGDHYGIYGSQAADWIKFENCHFYVTSADQTVESYQVKLVGGGAAGNAVVGAIFKDCMVNSSTMQAFYLYDNNAASFENCFVQCSYNDTTNYYPIVFKTGRNIYWDGGTMESWSDKILWIDSTKSVSINNVYLEPGAYDAYNSSTDTLIYISGKASVYFDNFDMRTANADIELAIVCDSSDVIVNISNSTFLTFDDSTYSSPFSVPNTGTNEFNIINTFVQEVGKLNTDSDEIETLNFYGFNNSINIYEDVMGSDADREDDFVLNKPSHLNKIETLRMPAPYLDASRDDVIYGVTKRGAVTAGDSLQLTFSFNKKTSTWGGNTGENVIFRFQGTLMHGIGSHYRAVFNLDFGVFDDGGDASEYWFNVDTLKQAANGASWKRPLWLSPSLSDSTFIIMYEDSCSGTAYYNLIGDAINLNTITAAILP